VSIIGLGASGLAAARLALKRRAHHVSDLVTTPRLALMPVSSKPGSPRRAGPPRRGPDRVGRHSSSSRPASLRTLRCSGSSATRGVRWIGEPEYAVRFLPGSLIAVTGTNGKTTTALLAAHLLRGGVDAEAGGNVGAGLPRRRRSWPSGFLPAWSVLEMSSFQLADTDRFAPDIGVVTSRPRSPGSIPGLESYYADKARLFRNARLSVRWVLNGESERVRDLPGNAPGCRLLFATDPGAGSTDPRPGEERTAAFCGTGS
jgi:UDP-N-acetylmuramoylalanine--D-glutamate ligase